MESTEPQCRLCGKSLAGGRFVSTESGGRACLPCYNAELAHKCAACGETIGCEQKELSCDCRHWHSACFVCSGCSVSLEGVAFASVDNAVYCGECHDARFAQRCHACGEAFRAGARKCEYNGRQYHEYCFICCSCRVPIGVGSFVPLENSACCMACYEAKFAQKCRECQKVIRRGGLSYKGGSYHTDCLVCTGCSAQLAGQKFTSRQDRPYCVSCYGRLFARRCCRCQKPIGGFDGQKFVSFEDRDWHCDCFSCCRCGNCLVGRGFLTEGEEILCTECGAK